MSLHLRLNGSALSGLCRVDYNLLAHLQIYSSKWAELSPSTLHYTYLLFSSHLLPLCLSLVWLLLSSAACCYCMRSIGPATEPANTAKKLMSEIRREETDDKNIKKRKKAEMKREPALKLEKLKKNSLKHFQYRVESQRLKSLHSAVAIGILKWMCFNIVFAMIVKELWNFSRSRLGLFE